MKYIVVGMLYFKKDDFYNVYKLLHICQKGIYKGTKCQRTEAINKMEALSLDVEFLH